MTNQDVDSAARSSDELTARSAAELISSLSKLVAGSEFGGKRVTDGLDHVSRLLRRLGDNPVSSVRLTSPQKPRLTREIRSSRNYRDLTLTDVSRLLDDDALKRTDLTKLAQERFGIPVSRLTKLRFDEAISTVRAAADHERSLDLIASNAERTGSERKS